MKKFVQPEDKVEVNVISLIDITFLVIVFLLVTGQFTAMDRMENLQLPSAMEAQPEKTARDRLIIGVDRDGNIIVGGQKKTPEELKWRLQAEKESRARQEGRKAGADDPTDQPILIQADLNVGFGAVRKVLQAAAEVGFRKLSFSTKIVAEAPSGT